MVSKKIRDFLIFAKRDGYDWAWADTCCIDKTSSAELTEAINSMFRYYSLAHICYVFLNDVEESQPGAPTFGASFRRSRWHTRGWTLQELLAPREVVFLSRILKQATGIPKAVLRSDKGITDVSIAARMSWASKRKTTRIEDEAYCLFGRFGVSMPTLYGEGRKAFYRLQEEIMKTSLDLSLFAWGGLRQDRPRSTRARADPYLGKLS
ncbi:uncharacterized protein BXZ73DRAFT_91226 [Epithele typhae]|uniref:uncharacterized protein n=1 Tax=Epithele typhae TaxID=378194 RepID=UPI0020073813|nr:uncharacterized protein BXZ73DRAFT_91226 [Epithele typhae]KAH9924635.1 hypothetical protein BXZ73DRAFT_91226 [Epithele typhae]